MHFDHDQFFVQPLNSFIQQSRTLSKEQYLAARYVFKVTWFHKMTTQGPVSQCSQNFTITKNVYGCFRCLLASTTPRTVYWPQFK